MTDTGGSDDLISQLQHVLDEKGIAVDVASFLAPQPSDAAPTEDVPVEAPAEVPAPDPTVTEPSASSTTDPGSSEPSAPATESTPDSATAPTSPVVATGIAAVEELKTRFPVASTVAPGQATIDSTVTQGNRVTTQGAITPNNPLKVLTDRVEDHFNELSKVVSDIEAILDRLKTLTNSIGVGL